MSLRLLIPHGLLVVACLVLSNSAVTGQQAPPSGTTSPGPGTNSASPAAPNGPAGAGLPNTPASSGSAAQPGPAAPLAPTSQSSPAPQMSPSSPAAAGSQPTPNPAISPGTPILLAPQTGAASPSTGAPQTPNGVQTLTLRQAIDEALTSPNARIAEEQVAVVRGQVRQAGLRINPRLFLQSEDLRPWDSSFSFADNTEDYGYFIQTVELAGKRSKRIALATANLHRTEAERSLRTQQIAGLTAASYWSAVSAQRIAALLTQDLAAVDDMVRYHQQRVDAGAMRGVDLIRMQIERDRIFLALEAAQRDSSLARIELFRQIGRPPLQEVQLTDDIASTVPLPLVDLRLALAQRADITIARDQLSAAEADLKLQHALATPDPDLQGGYKRNSGSDTLYTAISIPLPFRNRNQGEIERAEAQVRLARTSLEQTELLVRADIQAATENYQRQQQIVQQTLPDMRTRAKQNLTILTEAYRIGGVDLLRYIDAERTAIDIEITALRTFADYRQSTLRLQLAYGGKL